MKKTETKSTVLLKHHLKSLKLPAMHEECEKIAAQCAKDNADHLAFLLRLCELELIGREKRATDRRLKAAKFPIHKTMEDFNFEAQPSINRVLISELMRCEYIDKRESVILLGNPGTGKTHLATVLGIAACQHGKKARFWRRHGTGDATDGSTGRSAVDATEESIGEARPADSRRTRLRSGQ